MFSPYSANHENRRVLDRKQKLSPVISISAYMSLGFVVMLICILESEFLRSGWRRERESVCRLQHGGRGGRWIWHKQPRSRWPEVKPSQSRSQTNMQTLRGTESCTMTQCWAEGARELKMCLYKVELNKFLFHKTSLQH